MYKMKKITLLLASVLMLSGGAFAQDKACCKKKGAKCAKEGAACCKDKKGGKECPKDAKDANKKEADKKNS
jgi:hypothetical protein